MNKSHYYRALDDYARQTAYEVPLRSKERLQEDLKHLDALEARLDDCRRQARALKLNHNELRQLHKLADTKPAKYKKSGPFTRQPPSIAHLIAMARHRIEKEMVEQVAESLVPTPSRPTTGRPLISWYDEIARYVMSYPIIRR